MRFRYGEYWKQWLEGFLYDYKVSRIDMFDASGSAEGQSYVECSMKPKLGICSLFGKDFSSGYALYTQSCADLDMLTKECCNNVFNSVLHHAPQALAFLTPSSNS